MLTTRLKAAREARGWTQRDLSMECGFGEKQVWRYENGESDPSSEHLTKMAKALECSTDYLVGLVDEPNKVWDGEETLTPIERRLVNAVRRGKIVEALKVITDLAKDDKQTIIAY